MTTEHNDGGPAFPVAADEFTTGMSLRDYAALQALPAIIAACIHDTRENDETHAEMFARKSLDVADAFIAARVQS